MGVYQRGSDVWWCRFRIGGEEIRRSTGATEKREAIAFERALRVELERAYRERGAELTQRRSAQTLKDLLDADKKEAEARGIAKGTLRGLEYAHARILEGFGPGALPRAITYESTTRYVADRRSQAAKGQSIVRELQVLRRVVARAVRLGVLLRGPNEWPRVRRDPKSDAQRGKLIPVEILREWLSSLPPDAKEEATFVCLTGLRAGEVKRVRAEWIVPSHVPGVPAILKLPDSATKGRRARDIPLAPLAFEIVRRRIEAAPESPLVFSQEDHRRVYRERAWKAWGPDKRIHLRDLRHTFSTLALQGGADATATMRLMGHTDLRTTELYQSSTIQRHAHTIDAAQRLLALSSGHSEVGTVATSANADSEKPSENGSIDGAKNGTRTHDLLITNLVEEAILHLTTCPECIQHVTRHHNHAQVGTVNGHSARAQGVLIKTRFTFPAPVIRALLPASSTEDQRQ